MEGEDWMVGFDEVFDEMPEGALVDIRGSYDYPVARIAAYSSTSYRLELDLDGFSNQVPRVEINDGFLVITGTKTEYANQENRNYLQRGISARGFRRSYQLHQGDRVIGTNVHQGILHIDIEQAVPSAMEPVSSWVRAG